MLATSTQKKQQIWVIERIHRICSTFRKNAGGEPCLEQYEQQVRLMMDEEVSSAAAAWIGIIVQCLRQGIPFVPDQYIR